MKILGVSKMELQGKAAIITGGGAGIGESVPSRLAEAGVDIA
jgi:NAD(P)-dependent dehydrogenase (short-subunit alcohol dehydrogenase family)